MRELIKETLLIEERRKRQKSKKANHPEGFEPTAS